MPIYVYRCPDGHETERLERWPSAAMPMHAQYCPTCGKEAHRVMATPSIRADGAYSYRQEGK